MDQDPVAIAEVLMKLLKLVSPRPKLIIWRRNPLGTISLTGRKDYGSCSSHTLALSDDGALLTFGWGYMGRIEGVAAGLWHNTCISADGDVYAFGGNQFGQLGTGSDQAETLPRLLDSSNLENVNVKVVSCGARHTAVITGRMAKHSVGDGTSMASLVWVMRLTEIPHLKFQWTDTQQEMWLVAHSSAGRVTNLNNVIRCLDTIL